MVELLLFAVMTCAEADALMFRINAQKHIEPKIQIELIDTIRESVPECNYYWDAND
tara:strand:+ start:224 stop:391 length:168 start_codon:yes stop_codon:yes gene_type:complete